MYHHLILFLVEKSHQHSCSCACVCVWRGGGGGGGGGEIHISHHLVCELEVAQLHRTILKFHLSFLVLAMYADSCSW